MGKDTKKGFLLYYDYRKHLALLNDEDRGKLLMALLDYGEHGTQPNLDGAALMAFSFIQAQMDRDAEKYAETVKKRSEAGKMGGRHSKTEKTNAFSEKQVETEKTNAFSEEQIKTEEANVFSAEQNIEKKTNAFSEKQIETEEANVFIEEQTETKKANAFSEKQIETKKGDTVTDTDTVTVTDTDTVTVTVTDIDHPLPPKGGQQQSVPFAQIVELYHKICISYPKLRAIEGNRKKQISARWKKYGEIKTFRELFEKAEASSFLKGDNKSAWTADFDWLLRPTNMSKVLEGKYDNDRQKGGQGLEYNSKHSGCQNDTAGKRTETPLSGFKMADS